MNNIYNNYKERICLLLILIIVSFFFIIFMNVNKSVDNISEYGIYNITKFASQSTVLYTINIQKDIIRLAKMIGLNLSNKDNILIMNELTAEHNPEFSEIIFFENKKRDGLKTFNNKNIITKKLSKADIDSELLKQWFFFEKYFNSSKKVYFSNILYEEDACDPYLYILTDINDRLNKKNGVLIIKLDLITFSKNIFQDHFFKDVELSILDKNTSIVISSTVEKNNGTCPVDKALVDKIMEKEEGTIINEVDDLNYFSVICLEDVMKESFLKNNYNIPDICMSGKIKLSKIKSIFMRNLF